MLADFIRRQSIVIAGGRRFVVRPPSGATVLTALYHYEHEIGALVSGIQKVRAENPDAPPVTVADVARYLAGGARGAAVLATCCEMWGAAPGETEEALARDDAAQVEVAVACASLLTDASRVGAAIAAMFGGAPGVESDGPSDGEVKVYLVAREFGVTPQDVLDWPYETLLSVLQLMDYQTRMRSGESPGERVVSGRASADELRASGFRVSTPQA